MDQKTCNCNNNNNNNNEDDDDDKNAFIMHVHVSELSRCVEPMLMSSHCVYMILELLRSSNYGRTFKSLIGTGAVRLSHLDNATVIRISHSC